MSNDIITERGIGKRIETILDCIECRMDTVSSDALKRIMLGALASELENVINPYLKKLEGRWTDRLPCGKERPLRVEWVKLSKRANKLAGDIGVYVNVNENNNAVLPAGCPNEVECAPQKNLACQLELLSKNILSIYELLQPINSPQKYAGYFQDKLKEYECVNWREKQREWDGMMTLRTANQIVQFYKEQLQTLLDRLAANDGYNIIDNDRTTIYQEAAGIMLWQDDTEEQEQAMRLLYDIRSALYFADQCKRPLKQVMCEPAEESCEDGAGKGGADEKAYISDENLAVIKACSKQLEKHLRNGYSAAWVNAFWDNMSKAPVSAVLDKGNINKPLSCILGELCRKKVYTCEISEMAEIIWLYLKDNKGKPVLDSFRRYLCNSFAEYEELRSKVDEYVDRNTTLEKR